MAVDVVGEGSAALLVIVELVPTGAAGAEQQDIAGLHARECCIDGTGQLAAVVDSCVGGGFLTQVGR